MVRDEKWVNGVVDNNVDQTYNALVALAVNLKDSKLSVEELFHTLSLMMNFVATNAASEAIAKIVRGMNDDPSIVSSRIYKDVCYDMHSTIMALANLYKKMDDSAYLATKRVRLRFEGK